jgi:hypothetical protein
MLLKLFAVLFIVGIVGAGVNFFTSNFSGSSGKVASATVTSPCQFTIAKKVMTLVSDCQTDQTIFIPTDITLEGGNHKITAVDPAGNHFKGAVVKNGGSSASVKNLVIEASNLANVCDGGNDRLRGILFEEASGMIYNNQILNINQGASGCQEGNAIEVRNFGTSPTSSVSITQNKVSGYQKTGIIVNGNAYGKVTGNTVDGGTPVSYIARNGIQIGFGAEAQVKGNTVLNNSYTGTSTVSGGILVVGGPFYGSNYGKGTQIDGNTVTGNDIGVFLSNLEGDGSAPATQTNIKVVGNTISNNALNNNFGGSGYQAGISDVGNNDKLINNNISGAGYDPAANPGAYTVAIDADPSFTNKAKIHANDIEP